MVSKMKTEYYVSLNYGKEATAKGMNGKRVIIKGEEKLQVPFSEYFVLKKDTIKLRLGPDANSQRIVEIPRFKFHIKKVIAEQEATEQEATEQSNDNQEAIT